MTLSEVLQKARELEESVAQEEIDAVTDQLLEAIALLTKAENNPKEIPDLGEDENAQSGENAQFEQTDKTKLPEEQTMITETANIDSVILKTEGRPYGAKTFYVTKNKTLKLKAEVRGSGFWNDQVIWTTSDPNVATVTNGKVKVKAKKGTAVITAVSVYDNTKFASVTVKVSSKKIANQTLKLKKKTITLKSYGQTAQIRIKKYSKKTTENVTYKLKSGKKYVKVDKYGLVTCKVVPGKKVKKAKIQVKCGKKQAFVVVNILK